MLIGSKSFKAFLFLVVGVPSMWIGHSLYRYATHSQKPKFSVESLTDGGYYKGVIEGKIAGCNDYKISTVTVMLDDKPFDAQVKSYIGRRNFEEPFSIDTTKLSNGKHELSIAMMDSSFHGNTTTKKFTLHVDNTPFKALLPQSQFEVLQGRTLRLVFNTNKLHAGGTVNFLSKDYECVPVEENSTTFECFIPIDCEEPPRECSFVAILADAAHESIKLSGNVKIKETKFKRSKGYHFAKVALDEDKELGIKDEVLSEALEKWLAQSPKQKLWRGEFLVPLDMTMLLTPFGEIRTTAEKGRYLHKGVDIVSNVARAVVWAAQDGKVIVRDRFVMSGNTVVVDHGCGVHTLYYHLDDFSHIEIGDTIRKGNPIGRTGKTGYASGNHLHWELRVNNVPVDPFQWTEKTFTQVT